MKQFIVSSMLLVAAVLVGFTSANAETTNAPSGWTPSLTASSLYASKYYSGSCAVTVYRKPVIQTDLFLSFQNDFYADLWNSTPFEKWNKTFGTEQDICAGWAGPLSTFGIGGFASNIVIDVGLSYFDEPGLESFGANDMLETHVRLTKDVKLFKVFAGFEDYVTMPGTGVNGGNVVFTGISKDVAFVKDILSASTSFTVCYDDGVLGRNEGFFFRGSSQLTWTLTKHVSLIAPQLIYGGPITDHRDRKADGAVLGGVVYQF